MFLQLEYTYKNAQLPAVLKAYQDKMLSSRKGVTIQPLLVSENRLEFAVSRAMPLFAQRFFNLNSFEYTEVANINTQEKTIEISSQQKIASVTLKFTMVLFFDEESRSTKATALVKIENVPKILKKTVDTYSRLQFMNERDLEMVHLEKKY